MHAGRWPVVSGGLAFWLMDWINEIWNGLMSHFTNYAPVWAAPGDTACLILIGLNIEICLMFAVMGVAALLLLPAGPRLKICSINNRWLFAIVNSILAVIVECVLNSIGALTWDYSFWNMHVADWVHDRPTMWQQARITGVLGAIVGASLLVFGGVPGWL